MNLTRSAREKQAATFNTAAIAEAHLHNVLIHCGIPSHHVDYVIGAVADSAREVSKHGHRFLPFVSVSNLTREEQVRLKDFPQIRFIA